MKNDLRPVHMQRAHDEAPAPVRPIILLSQPRSGSTLVQRVLAAHPGISATAEPWFMLPLAATLAVGRRETPRAIEEFTAQLRGGRPAYAEELRRAALAVYARAAAPGSTYFLDKTPNYHLVAEELIQLLPEAKFLLLWRQPLSVVASNNETFARNRFWDPHRLAVDFYDGLANLVATYGRHRDRICAVRYEDLLDADTGEWSRVMAHLGMEFDPQALRTFADVRLEGSFKDPTGTALYRGLSREPLDKWKAHFRSPVRKLWAHRYLDWINDERLATMGYSLDDLHAQVRAIPARAADVPADLVGVMNSRRHRWRRRGIDEVPSAHAWRSILGWPRGF